MCPPARRCLTSRSHGYRIYKFLGSGAFGEVWLAQDVNLPRVVAVKTLRLGASAAERGRALQALRMDAHLLTQVAHPNVVHVYAWVTVGEQHYLVMQYVAGGSLADLLKAEGPLDWQRAARYVADVGEGLIAVHAQGIVHRDVKPSNILWEPKRDEAVLTDFGVGSRLAAPATVAGSLPYMAPEAYDGQVSPALDVYALASTLFHLVTGSQPFAGTRISDLKEQIARGLPDPDPRCDGLPEPLERVIRAGLTASADRRPGLKEFVATLRGSLNQLMADTLTLSTAAARPQAPVSIRLNVSRRTDGGRYEPVATTHPQPDRLTRDMKRVPKPPDQVRLRTGELVRIEVVANRAGYVTVFNVGPAGHLNLLYPDPQSADAAGPRRGPSAAEHPGRRNDAAHRAGAAVRCLEQAAALTPPRSVAQPGRTQDRRFSRLAALRRDPRHEARPAVGAAAAAGGLVRRGVGARSRALKDPARRCETRWTRLGRRPDG